MPIIEGFRTLRGDREARQLIQGLPVEDVNQTLGEVFGAGFRQENLAVNLIRYLSRDDDLGDFDPNYQVWEDPLVSDRALADPYRFSGVENQREALAIIDRIERNEEDERTLARAGGLGFVAGMTGGILSPENLIPVSWVGRVGRGIETAGRAGRVVSTADDAARLGVRLTAAERAAAKAGTQTKRSPTIGLTQDEISSLTPTPAAKLTPGARRLNSTKQAVRDQKVADGVVARDAAFKASLTKAQQERTEGLATLLGPEERQLQNALEEFRTTPGATAARAPIKARIDRHRANLAKAREDFIESTPLPKPPRALSEVEQQAIARVRRRAQGLSPGSAATRARDLVNLERVREGAMAKIAAETEALSKARGALLEGGPASVSVSDSIIKGATVGGVTGGASETVLQALQEGRDDELLANVFIASAGFGAIFGAVGGSMARYGNRRLRAGHEAMVEELTGGPLPDRIPDRLKLTPEEFQNLHPAELDARIIEMVRQHSPAEAELLVGGKPRAAIPGTEARARIQGEEVPPVPEVEGSGFDTGPVTEKHKLVGEDVPLVGRYLRAMMHTSPGARLMKNKRLAGIRDFARLAIPTPFIRRGPGIGVSLAAKIRTHSEIGMFLSREVTRLRGKQDITLWNRQLARFIRQEGKLVGEEALPGVAESATMLTRYFDDMKARLEAADMLPDGVDLGADLAYLTRIFDQDALISREADAIAVFTQHLGNEQKARELYEELTTLGYESFGADAYNMTGKASQLRARGLRDIPSSALEEFLIDDVNYLITRYARNVGAQLEYGRVFKEGTVSDRLNMTEFKREVTAKYDELRKAAKEGKPRDRIQQEFKDVMRDIEFLRVRQLGDVARDPFSASSRSVAQSISRVASFEFLGGAGFGSLPDLISSVFTTGAPTFFRVAMHRLKKLGQLRATDGDELKAMATLLEWTGQEHSRAGYYSSFARQGAKVPNNVAKTGFAGVVERGHNLFMIANLLRPVTAFARGLHVQAGQHKLLSIGRKLDQGGTLSRHEVNVLKVAGVDEATAKRYGKQIRNGKGLVEDEGILLAEIGEWDDQLGFDFRSAVNQLSMTGIPNPGPGEVPIMMSHEIGSIFFQFMGVVFGSNSNFLVSGLQRHDSAAFAGALGLLGTGMFVEAVKSASRGEEIPEVEDLVIAGMERSGLLGVHEMVNSPASRLTGGIVDYSNFLGAKTALERFGPVENVGDVVPGARAFEDVTRLVKTGFRLSTGERISEQEAKSFANRLPLMRGVQMTPIRQGLVNMIKE